MVQYSTVQCVSGVFTLAKKLTGLCNYLMCTLSVEYVYKVKVANGSHFFRTIITRLSTAGPWRVGLRHCYQ